MFCFRWDDTVDYVEPIISRNLDIFHEVELLQCYEVFIKPIYLAQIPNSPTTIFGTHKILSAIQRYSYHNHEKRNFKYKKF